MKVFLKLAASDDRAKTNNLVSNVEHSGYCAGYVEDENGNRLGEHVSSTIGWLRQDLLSKIDKLPRGQGFEVVDKLWDEPQGNGGAEHE